MIHTNKSTTPASGFLVTLPEIQREKMTARMKSHRVGRRKWLFDIHTGSRIEMPSLLQQPHHRFIIRAERIGKPQHGLPKKLLQPLTSLHNFAPRSLNGNLLQILRYSVQKIFRTGIPSATSSCLICAMVNSPV